MRSSTGAKVNKSASRLFKEQRRETEREREREITGERGRRRGEPGSGGRRGVLGRVDGGENVEGGDDDADDHSRVYGQEQRPRCSHLLERVLQPHSLSELRTRLTDSFLNQSSPP